jgi:hypothetical protein
MLVCNCFEHNGSLVSTRANLAGCESPLEIFTREMSLPTWSILPIWLRAQTMCLYYMRCQHGDNRRCHEQYASTPAESRHCLPPIHVASLNRLAEAICAFSVLPITCLPSCSSRHGLVTFHQTQRRSGMACPGLPWRTRSPPSARLLILLARTRLVL